MSNADYEQELPGPCPQGYYHFDFDGVPVYLDGRTNEIYTEDGATLIRYEGKLLDAGRTVEAIMQVDGRSEDLIDLKRKFGQKKDAFLALLEGAS